MTLQEQIKRVIDSYEMIQSYLKKVKIPGMTIEILLDKLLESAPDISDSDFDHPHAHMQLLSECEFDYASDDPNKLIAAASSSDFVFDPEEGQWF